MVTRPLLIKGGDRSNLAERTLIVPSMLNTCSMYLLCCYSTRVLCCFGVVQAEKLKLSLLESGVAQAKARQDWHLAEVELRSCESFIFQKHGQPDQVEKVQQLEAALATAQQEKQAVEELLQRETQRQQIVEGELQKKIQQQNALLVYAQTGLLQATQVRWFGGCGGS